MDDDKDTASEQEKPGADNLVAAEQENNYERAQEADLEAEAAHPAVKPPLNGDYPFTRIVVYSGGLDSYTLLHWVIANNPDDLVVAIGFDYGQRHSKELISAQDVCARLGIRYAIVELPMLQGIPSSALTNHDQPMPEGHYEAENMKQTVVPGRNTLMLATAMAAAEAIHPTRPAVVYYGAHAGDHYIYPDCRPFYIESMQQVFAAASDGRVSLQAPWMQLSKGEIVGAGMALKAGGASIDYAETWTCYAGEERPCGKCGACVERAEAFAFAGIADPLLASPEPEAAESTS